MAADRGRRIVRGSAKGKPPKAALNGVQLAAGVKLVRVGAKQKVPMLVFADAKVQLNEGAAAILQLCDGSRTSDEIVAEVSGRAANGALAADVSAFLEAARTRGWIV